MMRDFGMTNIPPYFTCPISLELLSDPVTLCTGQTYDRPCIEKWLAAGNQTCPVTMQKLHDLSIIPNHTLKHLIDQWLLKGTHHHHHHHHHHHQQTHEHENDHDHCYVPLSTVKQILESEESSLEQKQQAVEQVRFLSEDLSRESEGVIQLGFLSLLLGLIFGAKNSQEMMGLVEQSLDCVIKIMPFCCMKDLNLLLEESKFATFKILFKDGSFLVKISLCNLLQAISSSSSLDTQALATKIAKETEISQVLISLLDDYKKNSEGSEAGIKAILSILSSQQEANRGENLVKQGLIHSLVNYITEVEGKEKNMATKATRALELALKMESAKKTFLENEVQNGVKALVKMVFRVSGDDEGSESAVNCFMTLCSESVQVSESAICGGVLTQLLFLLQSQCCGRVKTRARLLLKLLRSMWSQDPNHV